VRTDVPVDDFTKLPFRARIVAGDVAGAISTVGISVYWGGGSSGSGPMPAATGSVALSPQGARPSGAIINDSARPPAFMKGDPFPSNKPAPLR
jgi:hypothetical protein